jgi:tRNA A37 methylthiotransferase MiaB
LSTSAEPTADPFVRVRTHRMNRVHIKTYGCQMNERDSEAVAAMLRARGYRIVTDENDCDILLLNTCSVRDAAEQKAIGKAAWRRTAVPRCSSRCPMST